MAELSTIARPYAQGLMQALQERKAGAEEIAQVLDQVKTVSAVTQNPEVSELVGDPKLTDDQLCDLITEACGSGLHQEVVNLLRAVIENGRLEAFPEIAEQFHELKNASEGIADAYIETAFELSQSELDSLLESLSKKFSGLKLNPVVKVNPALIGGVCVRVGDKLLDSSIRARLAQMKTTLTA